MICIVEKIYCRAKDYFDSLDEIEIIPAARQESELAAAVRDNKAFGVVVGTDKYVSELYEALPSGGLIARFGVGHDGIDKAKCTLRGIIVTNTPGVLDDSVAELAIWLIGALCRQISFNDKRVRTGQWRGAAGAEVNGKTLLILGCGNIGRRVARSASYGFGMNVIGYDTAKLDPERMRSEWGISELFTCLDDALAKADFVSVHLPSLESTKHFVDAEFLGKMKHGAFLINTARGSIVDESALYNAVYKGQIGGAGLDVYANEPYEPVDASRNLCTLENVVLTPHIGSNTNEASLRMAEGVVKNIRASLSRKYDLLDIVNKEVIDKIM